MHIERHIFGSYKGYGTLAKSSGVSGEDSRVIEGAAFGFGQSYDTRYYKSLAKTPAYFTRALRGGKRALTRVLEGTLDDNQRPTLRLVTAIVAQQDWDLQVKGDVGWLLQQSRIWEWDGASQIAAIELDGRSPTRGLGKSTVPLVLALMSEIEKNWASRRSTVVSASQYSLDALAALEMLMPGPARSQFTSANRSLSPQLPSSVNRLAAEANAQDNVNFRYQPNGDLSPYAQCLAEMDLTSAIPLEFIMTYNRFGAPAAQPSQEMPIPFTQAAVTIPQRPSLLPIMAVAVLAVVLAVGAFLGAMVLAKGQIDQLNQRVQTLTTKNEDLKNANNQACAELSSSLGARINSLEGLGQQPTSEKNPSTTPTTGKTNNPPEDSSRLKSLTSRVEKLEGAFNKKTNSVTSKPDGMKEPLDRLAKVETAMKAVQTSQYEKYSKDIDSVLDWQSLKTDSMGPLESSLGELEVMTFLDNKRHDKIKRCISRLRAAKRSQAIQSLFQYCRNSKAAYQSSQQKEEIKVGIVKKIEEIKAEVKKIAVLLDDGKTDPLLTKHKSEFDKELSDLEKWLVEEVPKK